MTRRVALQAAFALLMSDTIVTKGVQPRASLTFNPVEGTLLIAWDEERVTVHISDLIKALQS